MSNLKPNIVGSLGMAFIPEDRRIQRDIMKTYDDMITAEVHSYMPIASKKLQENSKRIAELYSSGNDSSTVARRIIEKEEFDKDFERKRPDHVRNLENRIKEFNRLHPPEKPKEAIILSPSKSSIMRSADVVRLHESKLGGKFTAQKIDDVYLPRLEAVPDNGILRTNSPKQWPNEFQYTNRSQSAKALKVEKKSSPNAESEKEKEISLKKIKSVDSLFAFKKKEIQYSLEKRLMLKKLSVEFGGGPRKKKAIFNINEEDESDNDENSQVPTANANHKVFQRKPRTWYRSAATNLSVGGNTFHSSKLPIAENAVLRHGNFHDSSDIFEVLGLGTSDIPGESKFRSSTYKESDIKNSDPIGLIELYDHVRVHEGEVKQREYVNQHAQWLSSVASGVNTHSGYVQPIVEKVENDNYNVRNNRRRAVQKKQVTVSNTNVLTKPVQKSQDSLENEGNVQVDVQKSESIDSNSMVDQSDNHSQSDSVSLPTDIGSIKSSSTSVKSIKKGSKSGSQTFFRKDIDLNFMKYSDQRRNHLRLTTFLGGPDGQNPFRKALNGSKLGASTGFGVSSGKLIDTSYAPDRKIISNFSKTYTLISKNDQYEVDSKGNSTKSGKVSMESVKLALGDVNAKAFLTFDTKVVELGAAVIALSDIRLPSPGAAAVMSLHKRLVDTAASNPNPFLLNRAQVYSVVLTELPWMPRESLRRLISSFDAQFTGVLKYVQFSAALLCCCSSTIIIEKAEKTSEVSDMPQNVLGTSLLLQLLFKLYAQCDSKSSGIAMKEGRQNKNIDAQFTGNELRFEDITELFCCCACHYDDIMVMENTLIDFITLLYIDAHNSNCVTEPIERKVNDETRRIAHVTLKYHNIKVLKGISTVTHENFTSCLRESPNVLLEFQKQVNKLKSMVEPFRNFGSIKYPDITADKDIVYGTRTLKSRSRVLVK